MIPRMAFFHVCFVKAPPSLLHSGSKPTGIIRCLSVAFKEEEIKLYFEDIERLC